MDNFDTSANLSDDNAYLMWVSTNANTVYQELSHGNKDLLDKVTKLTLEHFADPNTSMLRLATDIQFLKQAIAARQSCPSTTGDSQVQRVWDGVVHFIFESDSDVDKAQRALGDLEQRLQNQLRQGLGQHHDALAIDFSTPKNASLAFALLNTDFMDLDLSGYATTATNALALMIQSLIANRDKLPAKSQVHVDTLLNKFQGAYDIANWSARITQTCPTPALFHQAEQSMEQMLLQHLARNESLFLVSGWTAAEGHCITLELTPRVTAENTISVTGRIQNRGAGIKRHDVFVTGTKLAYDPALILDETSLEALNKSPFFSYFLQMQFMKRPRDPQERDTMPLTLFGKQDFYNVLLPSWPGGISFPKQPSPMTDQRGSTCSIKPLITEMKRLLGKEEGELAKFYITKSSWETFITYVGVTPDNVDQIQPLLGKFARRALKLQDKTSFTEDYPVKDDLEKVIQFCAKVDQDIRIVQTNRAQQYNSHTNAGLEIPLRENAAYHLTLPVIDPLPAVGESEPVQGPVILLPQTAAIKNPEQWVADHLGKAVAAEENGFLFEAQNILLYTLRALPNPSHVAWAGVTESQRMNLLKNISQMQAILLSASICNTGEMVLSPQQACLWVKLLGITYRLAKEVLPPDLCRFYARGVQTMITSRLSSLFSPLHPLDLRAFQDTVALIAPDSRGDQGVWDNPFTPPQGNSRFSFLYSIVNKKMLDGALQNPEWDFLYNISTRCQDIWKKEADQIANNGHYGEDASELIGILLMYNPSDILELDDETSMDKINAMIPEEYLALRNVFYHCCLALDFRGKKKGARALSVTFDADFENEGAFMPHTTVRFRGLKAQDSERYNRGVFADAFPLGSKQSSETFVTDLFSLKKNKISYRIQTDLCQLQEPELLEISPVESVSLNPLEVQDLFALPMRDTLVLPQLEHCFTAENLSRLESPLFQSIFLIALCNVKIGYESPLAGALDRLPNSREVDNFFSFLTDSLRTTPSWKVYCFLLRAYVITLSHCLHHVGPTLQVNRFISAFAYELNAVAKRSQTLDASEEALLAQTLLASIPYLSDAEALVPLAKTCHAIRSTLKIAAYNPDTLNDFHLREDMQNAEFQLKTRPDVFKPSDQHRLSSELPDEIFTHNFYQRLFTVNYPAQKLLDGYYEFVDDKGVTYRVQSVRDSPLRLFRQFPDSQDPMAWYAFREDDPFANYEQGDHPCSTLGGYFTTNTHVWCKVGDTQDAIVMDDRGTILCQVFPDRIAHPTSPTTVLFKDYDQPVLNALNRLTDKSQILAWKDAVTGLLSKIELKEFKLQFEAEISDGGKVRWKSSEYHGYFIDTHDKSLSFEPFTHYLVLINDKGQRKVIIPSRRISSKKIKFGKQSEPTIHQDTVEKLFSYDLDSQGLVRLPDDPKALLSIQYLLHLALEKQDYSLAQKALSALKSHPEKWNDSLAKMMSYFELPDPDNQDTWNTHPQASALRLQLKSLMLAKSSVEMDEMQKSFLQLDYLNYLNQLNNVPKKQRLSLNEERRLYDVLVDVSVSIEELRLIQHRIEKLTQQGVAFPEEIRFETAFPAVQALEFSSNWNWIDQEMQGKMIAVVHHPEPIFFSMRSSAAYCEHFLYFYHVLQQGGSSSAVGQVKALLAACSNDKDPHVRCIRPLLTAVADNPSFFPPYEELLKGNLVDALKELVKNRTVIGELSGFETALPAGERLRIEGVEQPARPVLEPTLAHSAVFTRPRFSDVSDNLLSHLIENGMISQGLPTAEEVLKIEKDLEHLKELEDLYTSLKQDHDDPATSREFGRLLAGIQEVRRKTTQTLAETRELASASDVFHVRTDQRILRVIDSALDSAIDELSFRKGKEDEVLKEGERVITEQLRRYPTELALEAHGGLLSPLTFEEALIAFGCGDDAPFYTANPALIPQDVLDVKEEIGRYLIYKLNAQKCGRLLEDLKKAQDCRKTHGEESMEYAIAKDHAIQTLQASRAYTAREAPHLLVYEAATDMCLREEQLSALDQLSRDDKNLIFEAKTGFGKSKALIPLWLHLTAKRRRGEKEPGMAMMTVPSSLFPQQVSHLKKSLGGAFRQTVFAFEFNRQKGNDLEFLNYLDQMFDSSANEGICDLTTVHSLHGLLDLKIEELFTLEKTEGSDALLNVLRRLRVKAAQHLSNFFDESQECFNIRNYFDYAIGAPQPISRSHCQAVELLYDLLLEMVSFDFLPGATSQGAPLLTEEQYHTEIKGPLAERLLGRLIPGTLPEPPEGRKPLLDHLMGKSDSAIDAFLATVPEPQRRQYGIYRKQLTEYLPRTLTSPCNGRYGLVSEKTGNRLAYPFDRGVPKLSSQFSSVDELLNFTIQANLKTPWALKDLSNFIESLKLRIAQAENKNDFMANEPDYQCYVELTGSLDNWPRNIADCHKTDIERLHQLMNEPGQWKLALKFTAQYLLPTISVHTKRVTSTVHNLVGSIQKKYGASAMVNTDTLSPKLKTIEQPSTLIGSLLSLWKNSQSAIFTQDSPNARELLLSTLAKHPEYRVIIDVASSFRDLRDEKEIALAIFEQTERAIPPVDAVSYYDEAGENRVFLRPKLGEKLGDPILRDRCDIPVDNIFVFMRQSVAVGADTPMSMTAKALVTVNSATQRDLFFQGVGRMRGLQTGQEIGFLIEERDADTFRNAQGEITLSMILAVVSRNHGNQRGQDLVFNLRLLLHYLVKKQFWNYFDHPEHSLDESRNLYTALKPFFVELSIQDPLDSLTQSQGIIPIRQAVEQIKNSFVRKLTPLITPEVGKIIDLNSAIAKFDALVDYRKLPKTAHMGSVEDSSRDVEVDVEAVSAEVEEEQQEEAENEEQRDQQRETISALPSVAIPWHYLIPSAQYTTLARDETLAAAREFPDDAFDYSSVLSGIYGSTNYFRFDRSGHRPRGVLKTALDHLIIREKGAYKVVLMDQRDTWETIRLMREETPGDRDYYLRSSTGKLVSQHATQTFDATEWANQPRLTLLVKIFSRRGTFTKREERYLASLDPVTRNTFFKFLQQEIALVWPPFAIRLAKLQGRVESSY